jgi:uncharacterized protein with gpF-like domain
MPPRNTRPGPVPVEALQYFSAKGLKIGFDYTDVWKEEHAVSFTVAKVMEYNILATVRGMVERALENGTTFRDFVKEVTPLLDQSGWSNYHKEKSTVSRLSVIFQTNMRVARSAGQWQRIERTKDILPFLVYELGPSVKHREEHESWAGTTLPADHSWWDDHAVPNGWMCKCWIQQISERGLQRLAKERPPEHNPIYNGMGQTQSPPSYNVEWTNPKTGRTEKVPVGIDPGWNYNPGRNRTNGVYNLAEDAGVEPHPSLKQPTGGR